jgi:alkylation response protein AidB-like acyl-CoA dehydrogenase
MAEESFQSALEVLARRANEVDGRPVWPEASWKELQNAGVLRWCIAPEYGGGGLPGLDLLRGYEQLANACLNTCFILSQRDAACRRLRDGQNEELRRQLLPRLAEGRTFITVGLSQMTTSRQHLGPTLRAREERKRFVLDGTIPWVTGAARADHFVIGAVLEDGRQFLAVLPAKQQGVSVGPPLELAALEGSLTAEIRLNNVIVERQWLLAGPVERVMTIGGRGGTGGVETSCLALGLAGAAIDYLKSEAAARPDLAPIAERLDHSRQLLRSEMYGLVEGTCAADAAAQLRGKANSLVLRASQAALTASKGTGFLRQHPAQRWARQALFFLVWSCPRPAADATLAYLAPIEGFCS